MQFLRSKMYECEIAVNAEECALLADALEIALENTVSEETVETQRQLELWKGFFQAAAVLSAMAYTYPLGDVQDRDELLEEIGLGEFVAKRRPQTLGEFIDEGEQLAAEPLRAETEGRR